MNYREVESSNIEALGHDGENLGVEFRNGSIYLYQGVSEAIFDQLVNAASVGCTFNELIKSKPSDYPYQRVA